MGDTIETFVARLQTEGVEAGKKEAGKISQAAQAQAEQVLKQAQAEAEKIIAQADERAKSILDKSQTELKLAARDTLLRLRDAIKRCLEAVLSAALTQQLSDEGFLRELLHGLIVQYAQADLEGRPTIEIRVAPETQRKLLDWTLQEISHGAPGGKHVPVDLKGTLSQAGFEYSLSGGTVEVTVESVAAVLKELISAELRRLLDEATAGEGKQG
ncbi:MAG TPA: hypothetical protein VNA25_11520 [Phycisphaerae bacterium]|nr:hypothetical protein [Phycisphaerae bacterium]HUT58463.1 hypothetical protein [Phycisphaerae bacterium]